MSFVFSRGWMSGFPHFNDSDPRNIPYGQNWKAPRAVAGGLGRESFYYYSVCNLNPVCLSVAFALEAQSCLLCVMRHYHHKCKIEHLYFIDIPEISEICWSCSWDLFILAGSVDSASILAPKFLNIGHLNLKSEPKQLQTLSPTATSTSFQGRFLPPQIWVWKPRACSSLVAKTGWDSLKWFELVLLMWWLFR